MKRSIAVTHNNKYPDRFLKLKTLYNVFFRQMTDFLFIINVTNNHQIVFANNKAMKHFPYLNDRKKITLHELFKSEQAEMFQLYTDEVQQTGRPATFVTKMTDVYEKTYVLEWNIRGIYQEGKLLDVVCIGRDITKNVAESNHIIVNDHMHESLMNHNLDAILAIDKNGKITQANPASIQLLGYSQKEILQQSIFQIVSFEEVSALYELITDTLNGEARELENISLVHKDKKLIVTHLKTVPNQYNGYMFGIYIIIRDVTDSWNKIDKINYVSYHDHLTQLWNRRALEEQLQMKIDNNKRLALFLIDLDRFKYVNETLGHKVGDCILKETAERLLSLKDPNLQIYRYGGDEFVVVLSYSSIKTAAKIARNVMNKFSNPYVIDHQEYFLSLSIGVSFYPDDAHSVDTLINRANNALSQVKQTGKGGYQFYHKDLKTKLPNKILMESHLRKAIEKNEFHLQYQPQVHLGTGEIQSFEALIRWNNRKFGSVMPGQFIPLAEETGLIIDIGEWVIYRVCEQITEWQSKGYRKIRVAINVSPKQFLEQNLPEIILKALETYQLDPNVLEIEITEGAMADTTAALIMLQRLKEIGVTISVDDFGTGYSSLNYLKQFPIDILKIDQSFIKEVQLNKKDAAITKTIIHLAHNLGMEVIAEGVEKKEQVSYLLDMACQKAQGYYFSRPLDATKLEQEILSKIVS